MVTVKIYVEGGGDHNKNLQTQCRRGFSEFFKRAGFEKRRPKIVACGGREQAYASFQTAHAQASADSFPILLVDSEGPVSDPSSWNHVRRHDEWTRPATASDEQLHLMVQAMEAWFHADKDALGNYFGRCFRSDALSGRNNIENIPKEDLFSGLRRATKDCQKGTYSKGEHSFKILALIHPAKVKSASPLHFGRLLRVLDRVC